MGLFEDLNNFLEQRLDEFLRKNPHLELQALEEQLREQEEDTLKLLADLQLQEKRLQDEILAIAQEIQQWHGRIQKAKSHGRLDLAQPAQEREAALLRQGNQRWGQMEGLKQRIAQAKELINQIQTRRTQVRAKATEVKAAQANTKAQQRRETFGWNKSSNPNISSGADLEEKFKRWEMDEELEQMKRNMGR
ncbi:MAG: TIGR04376 family protein [Symploca sp. SIO2G7]|nr:TIGR04376 family protein [Symploca sp. SIO2G7]